MTNSLCWGLMTRQPLYVILCLLPEKGRRDRRYSRGDEREGQARKRNRNGSEETEEIKTFPNHHLPLSATRIAGLAQLEANDSWTCRCHKIPNTIATPNHPWWMMKNEIGWLYWNVVEPCLKQSESWAWARVGWEIIPKSSCAVGKKMSRYGLIFEEE